jgi:rhodanese-related sulfurtransferase
MGVSERLGVVAQVVSGWLGLAHVPSDPAAREARVEALYQQLRGDFPAVVEVRADALVGGAVEVVWVDVRPAAERAVSTLPGAVPSEVIEADPDAWRERRLVAYCTVGYRSGRWAEAWSARGLRVENLAGGVLAWSWAGGGFEAGGAATTAVHVYGPAWDLLAPGYASTW